MRTEFHGVLEDAVLISEQTNKQSGQIFPAHVALSVKTKFSQYGDVKIRIVEFKDPNITKLSEYQAMVGKNVCIPALVQEPKYGFDVSGSVSYSSNKEKLSA